MSWFILLKNHDFYTWNTINKWVKFYSFWFYSGLMVLNAVIEKQVTIENEIKSDQKGKDEMISGLGKTS